LKQRSAVIVLVASALLGVCRQADSPGDEDVPSAFAALHADLSATLDQFEQHLGTLPQRRTPVIFGGEVLPANSHRGEELLTEPTYQGALLYIDRLRALGAGGVTVAMDYPILNQGFPRSEDYWAFYRRLAGDVRARGLRLHVKVGPLFPDREFSRVPVDYSGVTADAYFRDRRRIAQRIAAEVRPDYLSMANEPAAEAQILGFPITPERYLRFVNDTLAGMNRSVTLVGAGSGNWDSPEYVQRFARETSLDFIDIHVYPLAATGADYLRRAADLADIASAAGKRVIIGEAWLYKAGRAELSGNPTAPGIFARDVFSFWAPLDARFLDALGRLATLKQIEYVSPFWTKYLFGYVEYDDRTASATSAQLTALVDQEVVRRLTSGGVSPSGEAYQEVANRYR
jgi:hypothetical protein